MALQPGTAVGPFQIISLIGRGGMGEVYCAHDTRLSRDVALKLLHGDVAANPTRRAQFEREAQAISQLNHPHICGIYDIGSHDGAAYIVMEYIEGESLAARLRRGPLPPRDALQFAIQMGGALDAAHRRGITHRDLKPANVMICGATAKLLDFGLAKVQSTYEETHAAIRNDSTMSLTAERNLVGTLHYMAPEQLEGRDIDSRTDLFAFGAMLYEMLTARRPFEGASDAGVTAAILTVDPQPVSSVQAGVPQAFDRIVTRALAKRPDARWQTARDVVNELQWIVERESTGASIPPLSSIERHRLALAGVGLAALLAGFAAHAVLRPGARASSTPVHLSFSRPPGVLLTNTGRPVLTISPDGRKIVFNANNQLYVRSLDAAESVPIQGTQGTGVTTPFFSPDGRWIAFFSFETGDLEKVPVEGGTAVTMWKAPQESRVGNFGASWTTEGQVIFATLEGVFRLSPDTGVAQQIVTLEAGASAYGPQLLPDGDHVLLTITTATGPDRWDKAQIVAHSLSAGTRTVLVEGGSDGRYLDTGHLVYAAGTTIFAVPIDLRALRTLAAPVPILSNVRRAVGPAVNTADASLAFSRTGNLVYIRDTPFSLVSVAIDMNGRATQLDVKGLAAMQVSPDGSRILGSKANAWWIYPMNGREAPRKLVEAVDTTTNLVWTPDGQHIAFRSRTRRGMFWQSANGEGSEELLLAVDGIPIQWSRDGTTLLYLFDRQLWSWSRGGRPRVIAPMEAPYASVSPDNRWVAYHVTEHGTAIPYIQSLVNPSERFQITQNGGHAPLWSADGRKLFYVSGPTNNSLMAVDVRTAPTVTFGQPVMLAPRIFQGLAMGARWFDATPDGTKVLAQIPDGKDPQSWQFDVVLNWFGELKRSVPTP